MSGTAFASSSDIEAGPSSNPQPSANVPATSAQSAAAPSDPALSLRAAALLTLKSKRRKPTDQSLSVLPRPSPADTSFQLDYGQEDIVSSPPASVLVPTPSIDPPSATAPEVEDGQIREEGEISDSEGTPPPASKLALPSTPKESLKSLPAPLDLKSTQHKSLPPRSTGVKVESPTHHLLDRITDPPPLALGQPGSSGMTTSTDVSFIDNPPYLLDADHVRPGLASSFINNLLFFYHILTIPS
jgi:hypothetical protein